MAAPEREAPNPAFLAERYWPGVDEPMARSAMRRLVEQATAADGNVTAQVLACTFVPREQAVLVLIRARSDEAVAEFGRQAGVAFDRIVEAVVVLTDPRPGAPETDSREAGRG